MHGTLRRPRGASQAELRVGTFVARGNSQNASPCYHVRVCSRHGQLHRCVWQLNLRVESTLISTPMSSRLCCFLTPTEQRSKLSVDASGEAQGRYACAVRYQHRKESPLSCGGMSAGNMDEYWDAIRGIDGLQVCARGSSNRNDAYHTVITHTTCCQSLKHAHQPNLSISAKACACSFAVLAP